MEYIKLDSNIKDWEWIDDPAMVYLWLRILLMANHEGQNWRGVSIERGSFVTSIFTLSAELGLSPKQVRTCIDRLIKGKRIGKRRAGVRANEKTIVTIYDFDSYIGDDCVEGQTRGKRSGKQKANEKEESPLTPPNGFLSDSLSFTPYNPPEENLEEGDTDVSPKKRDKPVSGPPDFSFVLDLWNSYATRSVPKIRSLSPARKEKVKLRVREMGGWEKAKEIMPECFRKISESDFCNGATGKWAANFDWFFENEKNWLKVLEGNYDNRKEKTQLEVLAEHISKAHEYYGQRYGYGGASAYGNPAGSREDSPDEQ